MESFLDGGFLRIVPGKSQFTVAGIDVSPQRLCGIEFDPGDYKRARPDSCRMPLAEIGCQSSADRMPNAELGSLEKETLQHLQRIPA